MRIKKQEVPGTTGISSTYKSTPTMYFPFMVPSRLLVVLLTILVEQCYSLRPSISTTGRAGTHQYTDSSHHHSLLRSTAPFSIRTTTNNVSFQLHARKTLLMEPIVRVEEEVEAESKVSLSKHGSERSNNDEYDIARYLPIAPGTMTGIMIPLIANAATDGATRMINLDSFKTGLTVENFQPVCGTSDSVYRVLQQTIAATVGPDKFTEYGPLIAGGLLRVRLELCVVESFITEAVVPFIRDNGVSWILPLHETVETFLAGAIFALATTFILIGSTKLVTVLITYTDFIFGLPSRLFGGFIFDRAQGKPVTLDIGIGPLQTRVIGPPKDVELPTLKVEEISPLAWLVLLMSGTVNYFGKTLQLIREIMEAIDSFVGRYLVLWATAYLIIKFLHFKVFPDFP